MIYEFECSCGKIEDINIPMTEISKATPHCTCGKLMARVYSPISFHISPEYQSKPHQRKSVKEAIERVMQGKKDNAKNA